MLAIKFLKIDVTMYLFELRIAFACVTCLNFLSLALVYSKIQVTSKRNERVEKRNEQVASP